MPITVRTLSREFRLIPPDEEARVGLAFMATAPEIVGAALEPVDLPVLRTHGFLSLRLPDGRLVEGAATHLLAALHGLIYRDVVASEAGAPLVHGATVIGEWGRAVVIGAKSSGKTTLALHLVARGYRVEADEHLVIGADSVVARPRTLRVKPGSLEHVPELADAVRHRPFVATWNGMPIHAVEPSIAGVPWRIERGPLDHLVFLEANHGGRSVMAPLAADQAFRRLLSETILPRTGIAAAAARLRSLVMRGQAWTLALGDLDGALWHLRQIGRDREPLRQMDDRAPSQTP